MSESEAWTVVKTKTRRLKPSPASNSSSSPSRVVPKLTKEEIQKDFEAFNVQFKASPCAEALREIFLAFVSDSFRDDNKIPVSKAICLGIGSFDPPDGSWQLKRRTHTQLAAMLFMVELLEEKTSSGPINCLFQEPAFTSSDVAFLSGMKHEVVDSPFASDSVDSRTLFFGPHLYKDIYAMSLKGDLPAIWVGTGWDVWSDVNIGSLPEDVEPLLAIKKMDETYRKLPFPEDEKNGTIFYATSIYLRHPEKREVSAVEEAAVTKTQEAAADKEATPTTDGDTSNHEKIAGFQQI